MHDGWRAGTNESVGCASRLWNSVLILFLCFAPQVLFGQVGGVRGVVHDSLGGVVNNAHLSIKGSRSQTTSDSTGAFRIADIPPGDAVLEVRRLGYRPTSTVVTIGAGNEGKVDVELAPVPELLAPVQVRPKTEVYDSRLAGFNERKTKHIGHFVTRDQLDRMSSARFVDAIRVMPGVSMRTLRGGIVTVSIRGARCAPLFYMDGFPASAGTMDLDMIDLSGVEGIELYGGMSSIPAEFMTVAGHEGCGVIAVWSRPTRSRRQRIDQTSNVDLEKLLSAHAVYTSDQVDEPAHLNDGSSTPIYPDSLFKAGVGGRVVAEFVVDPEGVVETSSLGFVSATHPHFASAVRSALAGAVFRPAVLAGKPVRQIVQLPFVFSPEARDSISASH
jgi:TonB family protein